MISLNLEDQPARLKAGEKWTLRYRLAALSSPADHDRLSKLAGDWKTSDPNLTPTPQ